MKLLKKLLFLIVTSLFVVGFCFFNNFVEAKEMTQEEISESVRISKADRMNIIQSIPQILTNQWVDSVVEASTPRDQAIVLILRGAVRSKIRDYLLTEAPKELSVEVIKGLYKLVTMSVTKDLSTMIKEIEKMTVKESRIEQQEIDANDPFPRQKAVRILRSPVLVCSQKRLLRTCFHSNIHALLN